MSAQRTVPPVAVCIPLYNKEKFVGETIGCVLDQTFPEFELVILDNKSTDRSLLIARSFRDPRLVVLQNSETVGPIENFNRVVTLSSAPFVKVLCADDLIHPDCLRRQVEALRADRTLAMATCRQHMIDESGRVLAPDRGLRKRDLVGRQDRATIIRRLVRHGGNPIGNPGNVLFRRTAFDAAGGFPVDGDFFTIDVQLWIGLLEHGRYLGMPESLASFRINSESDTRGLGSEVNDIQRRFIREVCRQNSEIVRGRDRMLSAARAPLTRLRHRVIVAAGGASGTPTAKLARSILAVGRGTPAA
jgi:glycosyltransferase involved in cell wall biosynthesis